MAQSTYHHSDQTPDQVSKTAENAEQTANHIADQSRQAGKHVKEVAGNFKGALDKSVKDQPMATLAVAGALGFVLGAIWKA